MHDTIKQILVSKKSLLILLTNDSFLSYIENDLKDYGNNMYFRVDSLIQISNIITGQNNITLRKVSVVQYRFDKFFMDKDLIEDKLYQIIFQVNERKITPVKSLIILNKG